MSGVNVLAVMDAYSVPGQVCCGMLVGGGYDENGNGEPPSCCGQPFNEGDMQEARAAVAELIEAAMSASAIVRISGLNCIRLDTAIARVGGAA